MKRSIITPQWRMMTPFRVWQQAFAYTTAGMCAVFENNLSPRTGHALKYDVTIF